MSENVIYTPQDADFVPAAKEHRDLTASEAVTGSKHDMRKRFFAQRSAVAGLVILALLNSGSMEDFGTPTRRMGARFRNQRTGPAQNTRNTVRGGPRC